MVVVARFSVCTGSCTPVNIPDTDDHRAEFEQVAALLQAAGHAGDVAYVVLDLPDPVEDFPAKR